MTANTPTSLVKYCDAADAVQILNSKCLRWSSPDDYLDPFELSADVDLGFDEKVLLESVVKLASSMLFSNEQPKGDSPLINAIKRWRAEERFVTPDEAIDVLRDLLSKMVSHRAEALSLSLEAWRTYVLDLRLCCFCEKSDSVVAWEKYANWHQGVALRFKMSPSGPLSNPKQVVYQAEPPQLTTIREQLAAILNNKDDNMSNRFNDQYLSKGAHHKQEREWRCFDSGKALESSTEPTTNISDVGFAEEQLAAVYFGLKTSDEEKKKISQIIKDRYKGTRLFQVSRARSGYALEIEKL